MLLNLEGASALTEMSTFTQRGRGKVTLANSTGVFSVYDSSWTSEEYIAKSATSRRVKPSDLFANGTSLYHEKWKVDRSYGTQVFDNGAGFTTALCSYWIDAGQISPVLEVAENEVSSKLRAKIKSQNVNLAQSFAEYRQTSTMFLGAARDLIQTFRSLRNGRAFADFVRILQKPRSHNERALANRWLEYQYGVRPLMQDIYGTTDLLVKKIREGQFMHVSAQVNAQRSGQIAQSNRNLSYSYKLETTRKGKARYKIQSSAVKTLAECGISNPVLLAWELIPYSFVVDWLFPVGNFLSSIDALNGTSDLRVIYSITSTQHSTAHAYGASSNFEKVTYQRLPPTGVLSMPSLSYKPSSSLTAISNGLALLTQFRTGR